MMLGGILLTCRLKLDRPQPHSHFDAIHEHYLGGALLKRYPSRKKELPELPNVMVIQASMTGPSLMEIDWPVNRFARGLIGFTERYPAEQEAASETPTGLPLPPPETPQDDAQSSNGVLSSHLPRLRINNNPTNQATGPWDYSNVPEPCASEICPIQHHHYQGPYFAQENTARTWNTYWGYSDRPASVYQAWAAIGQGRANEREYTMVAGFAEHHS